MFRPPFILQMKLLWKKNRGFLSVVMVMRPFKNMSAVCGPHSRTVVVSLITITIQDFGVSNSLSACNTPVVHDPGHLIHTKSGGKLRKNQALVVQYGLNCNLPCYSTKSG